MLLTLVTENLSFRFSFLPLSLGLSSSENVVTANPEHLCSLPTLVRTMNRDFNNDSIHYFSRDPVISNNPNNPSAICYTEAAPQWGTPSSHNGSIILQPSGPSVGLGQRSVNRTFRVKCEAQDCKALLEVPDSVTAVWALAAETALVSRCGSLVH